MAAESMLQVMLGEARLHVDGPVCQGALGDFRGQLPADLGGVHEARVEVEDHFRDDEGQEHRDLHHVVVVELLHTPDVEELVGQEEARQEDVCHHHFFKDFLRAKSILRMQVA